jgi:hypothetical protein
VFACYVHKGMNTYAVAMTHEALKFCGRKTLLFLSDKESAVNVVVEKVAADRQYDTTRLNTPKASSQSAGQIERANQEVEKQFRTLRSRVEDVYKIRIKLEDKVVPWMVRHASWLITHYLVKQDGKTPYQRLRGREYHGEVCEFLEIVFHKIPIIEVGRPTTAGFSESGWARAIDRTSTSSGPSRGASTADRSGDATRASAGTRRYSMPSSAHRGSPSRHM